MALFPQLNARGLIVQRPYTRSFSALTTSEEQSSGRRYARSWRANPLATYTCTYSSLTDAEYGVLSAFFDARKGRYEAFAWIDPAGNLARYSEDFAQSAWVKSGVTVGAAVADPFGGTRATSVTGASGAAYMQIDLEPTAINGRVLCASAWLRSASGGNTVSVGFLDGSNFYREVVLAAGVWTRVEYTRTITDAGTVSMLIGIGAGVVQVFGAQVAATPGAGAYARSPAQYGYRPNCRFGADTISAKINGPNSNAVGFTIEEFYSA